MEHVDQKVMAAVASELQRNPAATVDELFAKARDINPAIAELSKRQFHARYPLQVKRKSSPPKRRAARRSGTGPRAGSRAREAVAMREAVRSVLLDFASDLAAAEERKELIQVVGGVDRYVDQVMTAARR